MRDEDSGTEEVDPPLRKRIKLTGKASTATSESEEIEEPRVTRGSKSKSASSTRKQQQREMSDSMDIDEKISPMNKKWEGASSWERLVDTIDTVERAENGTLSVYFTLYVHANISAKLLLTTIQ